MIKQILNELSRRNVFKVAAAYTVSAWILIQVAETIFPLFGYGDRPARIVVVLLAIGFPFVLIFSWVYELTPDGLKLERDIDRSRSITHHTGHKLDRAIIIGLTVALGYFAFDKFVLDPARDVALEETVEERTRDQIFLESYGDRSIAVLPFVNMSDDSSNEYFSDDISEEVLNLLAKISELRVISRSSAFSFKGKDVAISEIAEQLDVAHILEGSVRKAGNTVRITAQLIEARTDRYLWSHTYDRELDDIFAIQDEIASTVVENLKVTLLADLPRSQPIDPEAYSLFLQAQHLRKLQTEDSLLATEELYKQSLAIQPDYAPSWIGLGSVYDNQVMVGLIPQSEGYALAKEAIEKALQIDSESADAWDSLGWVTDKFDGDIAQAATYVERALQKAPHDLEILASAARMLQNLGRLDEAIVIRRYVVARDPLNPIRHNNIGASFYYDRNFVEAHISMSKILEISPDYLGARYFVGITDLMLGNADTALESFELEEDEAWRLKGEALANFSLGRSREADMALADLIDSAGDEWPAEVAHVYAFRNELDDAFLWLDRSLEEPGGWAEGRLDPLLENLYADPRWEDFLEKAGVSDQQLAEVKFDLPLPLDGPN